MLSKKKWGGVRDGAGRPHEHTENVLVEVVDFCDDPACREYRCPSCR